MILPCGSLARNSVTSTVKLQRNDTLLTATNIVAVLHLRIDSLRLISGVVSKYKVLNNRK